MQAPLPNTVATRQKQAACCAPLGSTHAPREIYNDHSNATVAVVTSIDQTRGGPPRANTPPAVPVHLLQPIESKGGNSLVTKAIVGQPKRSLRLVKHPRDLSCRPVGLRRVSQGVVCSAYGGRKQRLKGDGEVKSKRASTLGSFSSCTCKYSSIRAAIREQHFITSETRVVMKCR